MLSRDGRGDSHLPGDRACGPGSPCDFGACATIGYVANPAFGNNVQWSFNTDSLVNVCVLSIFQDMEVIPSSPLTLYLIALEFTPASSVVPAVHTAPVS